ncbi:MAG TPA: hypothetical protein VGO25_13515 [Rhodanobacteraceae bacterium]|jgi:hypothetical protein|nr:hypothetical protein [Rhodanobacteraceae bacterium]
MDLYLPDEFYALSESPNPRRSTSQRDDRDWLGGEAFVAPFTPTRTQRAPAEPDPIWRVV